MRLILFLLLIIAISGSPVVSQHVRQSPPLPAGIAGWSGEDSGTILGNPVIKGRLKALLGKKNYAAFMESFETLTPIEKKGNMLFSSGCLIHACTQLESAVAIDLVRGTIHAAIFRRNENTKFFNQKRRRTPNAIRSWAARLEALRSSV